MYKIIFVLILLQKTYNLEVKNTVFIDSLFFYLIVFANKLLSFLFLNKYLKFDPFSLIYFPFFSIVELFITFLIYATYILVIPVIYYFNDHCLFYEDRKRKKIYM